jgi:hypothetical protein
MSFKLIIASLAFTVPVSVSAQIGQHRNDLSVGVNAGYMLSDIGFVPKVTQGWLGAVTGGFSIRYLSEKYFNTYCSIYAELNYAPAGWKENIVDVNNAPVINSKTNVAEKYSRTINYIQVPIMAHLAWGKEGHGVQFFFHAGPQFGFFINESTSQNFNFADRNTTSRANNIAAQDTMSVQNSFDYGIAAGVGMEYTVPKLGHFLVEARYYFGLGNIYGDSKRDYFSKSNIGNIVVKMSYLFDITKTKNK